MSKDKKKKKKMNVIEHIEFTNLNDCARVISRVNPYMKDVSEYLLKQNMTETVTRTIQESHSSFVSTACWLATIEEYADNCYYVYFYVDATRVNTYISK